MKYRPNNPLKREIIFLCKLLIFMSMVCSSPLHACRCRGELIPFKTGLGSGCR